MKSWTPPTDEMLEKVTMSVKKETDRQYFFSKLKNPLWVQPLHERGYFSNPPRRKDLPDGFVQFPHWPELKYLVTVAEEASEQVVKIVLSLPSTDNPNIYNYIVDIALKLDGNKSIELLPKIIEGIRFCKSSLNHRYSEVLQYWTSLGKTEHALKLLRIIIPFFKDPKTREKQLIRKKNPRSVDSILEPEPRFEQWEYQQLLDNGVRPLVDREPYLVAYVLISEVANMIRLGFYPDDLKIQGDEDFSEIWCPRLGMSDFDCQDRKEALTQALTDACEKVYEVESKSIELLDDDLRKEPWKLFKRLRQHLYASYPNEQILPWIREQILSHEDYAKCEHHFEFQRMIRESCEHFGQQLLSSDERKVIFDSILSGPSKADFQNWMEDQYTEEAFQKRQRYFHRKQLHPFYALLYGEVLDYFNGLEGEIEAKPITDDSYKPCGGVSGGSVIYRSPKSREDLDKFTDRDLLDYLNNWDDEHHDKDNWLIEINFFALADIFQSLFKDKIIRDNERFGYWI